MSEDKCYRYYVPNRQCVETPAHVTSELITDSIKSAYQALEPSSEYEQIRSLNLAAATALRDSAMIDLETASKQTNVPEEQLKLLTDNSIKRITESINSDHLAFSFSKNISLCIEHAKLHEQKSKQQRIARTGVSILRSHWAEETLQFTPTAGPNASDCPSIQIRNVISQFALIALQSLNHACRRDPECAALAFNVSKADAQVLSKLTDACVLKIIELNPDLFRFSSTICHPPRTELSDGNELKARLQAYLWTQSRSGK